MLNYSYTGHSPILKFYRVTTPCQMAQSRWCYKCMFLLHGFPQLLPCTRSLYCQIVISFACPPYNHLMQLTLQQHYVGWRCHIDVNVAVNVASLYFAAAVSLTIVFSCRATGLHVHPPYCVAFYRAIVPIPITVADDVTAATFAMLQYFSAPITDNRVEHMVACFVVEGMVSCHAHLRPCISP